MKNTHFLLVAVSALLVLSAVSSYTTRVSTAGDRVTANLALPTIILDSADIFEANRLYDLAISDAGNRTIYRCRVVQTRSNWVFCEGSWRTPNGAVQNGNLWTEADQSAARLS